MSELILCTSLSITYTITNNYACIPKSKKDFYYLEFDTRNIAKDYNHSLISKNKAY